jgi:ribosomal protein L34E
VSQSASPSKLNFRFVGSPIVLHWEGHNSSIRSAIEVNEHLVESLFDNLLNRSGPTSISYWQGLQIIETFCRYFLSGATASSRACYSHLGPRPKLEHAPRRWRTPKRCPRMSSSLATTLGVKQGRPSKLDAQSKSSSSPSRAPGLVCSKIDV